MKIHAYIYSLTVAGLIGAAYAADPPTTENPAAAGDGVQVGVAKRDGITVTANEVFITRNGATERLSKELVLPSGVIARPDGTMVLPDKTEATLRASQLLTLEGKVIDIPLDPNVNPAPPQKTGANAPGSAQNTQPGAAMNRNGSGTGGNAGGRLQSQNGGGAASLGDTIATSGNGVPNGNGTNANVQTFIDRNGMEFTGTINQDGSINTTDGRSIVNDGTVRTVMTDQNGAKTFGTVSRNGMTTRADGTTVSADGTVRSSDGRVIGQNGNVPPNANGTPQNANSPGTTGFTVPAGNQPNTNSPNNAGTVNRGDARNGSTNSPNNAGTVNVGNGGGASNNTGTVNNPASTGGTNNNGGTTNGATTPGGQGAATSNPSNAGRGRTNGTQATGGARNGGSTSGGGTGTGSSGAGGASGGGGGGASR